MTQAAPEIFTETITPLQGGDPLSFRMIKVEGGEFWMGSEDEEDLRSEPVHQVELPTFWMGEFPVTQTLWQAVLGENPAYFPGLNRPVESVSWFDITNRFLPALNKLCKFNYRLPSESEWEYASKGGQNQSSFLYAGSNRLKDVGWYNENSHNETKEVGLKLPNALGLFDMSGNVWEWCEDHWHNDYKGAPKNGSAWIEEGTNLHRVIRSSAWISLSIHSHLSDRDSNPPGIAFNYLGFRLVSSSCS